MEQDKEIAIESIRKADEAIVVVRRNEKLEFVTVGGAKELESLRLILIRRLYASIVTGTW